jgi:peroxiredoxin
LLDYTDRCIYHARDPIRKETMPDNAPLKSGQPAPDFELMNQKKEKVKLSDFRGKKKVVLLFYPMDFSPVCTQEHCTFGPELGKITGTEDAVVLGVS